MRNSSRIRRRHAALSTHDAAQNSARRAAGGANSGESSFIGGSGRRRTTEAAASAHATGSATHERTMFMSRPKVSKPRDRDPPPLGVGPTDPRGLEAPPVSARTAARSTSSAAAAATCCAKLANPAAASSASASASASCVATNRPVSSFRSGPHTSVTPAASATARAAGVRGEKMSRAARALGGLRLQVSDSSGATRWNTAGWA